MYVVKFYYKLQQANGQTGKSESFLSAQFRINKMK